MKKYTLLIVTIIVLAGGAYFTERSFVASSGTIPVSVATTTAVVIPVRELETVLAAMQAYASDSSFTFTGKDYPSLGYFVESINGRENADGFYWTLYVDGTLSSLGASAAKVVSGELVEWRYQHGAE